MAQLWQLINNIPGLTGSGFDKQKQLYERLGSPMGPYNGSLQQNLFLINKINTGEANKSVSAPQPAAPSNPYDQLVNSAVNNQIAKATPVFDKAFEKDYFNEDLVRQSYLQLFKPEADRLQGLADTNYNEGVTNTNKTFDRGVLDTNDSFANSGTFFSGVRNQAVNNVNANRQRSLSEMLRSKEEADLQRKRALQGDVNAQVEKERQFKYNQFSEDKKNFMDRKY